MNTFNILAIKKESARSLFTRANLSRRLSSKQNYVMWACPTDASHSFITLISIRRALSYLTLYDYIQKITGVRQVFRCRPRSWRCAETAIERSKTRVSPGSRYRSNPDLRNVLRHAVDSCWTMANCCSPRCSRAWTRCPIGNVLAWTIQIPVAWIRRRSRHRVLVTASLVWCQSAGPSASIASPGWEWVLISPLHRLMSRTSVSWWVLPTMTWCSELHCSPYTSRRSISTWSQASATAAERRIAKTVWCWCCCCFSSRSCASKRISCCVETWRCVGSWYVEGTRWSRASYRPSCPDLR